MLPQEAMIEKVRQVCNEDDRLVAAMMYGSFAQGEGDRFSDIEFVLFFEDELLPHTDQEEWVAQVAPVVMYFVNEFGVGTAIFENLVRGEFHFDVASDIEKIDESWREFDWLPSLASVLILDRTGQLTQRLERVVGPPLHRDTPERAEALCHRFIDWSLFGSNLVMRGELARALEILGFVQRHLLWMIRLSEETTAHWATPSKKLEADIPEGPYARYSSCTANVDEAALWSAYLSAWAWGKELMEALSERHGFRLPDALVNRIGSGLAGAEGTWHGR
jgi:lincosamide nucleotidyltransferase B/F